MERKKGCRNLLIKSDSVFDRRIIWVSINAFSVPAGMAEACWKAVFCSPLGFLHGELHSDSLVLSAVGIHP